MQNLLFLSIAYRLSISSHRNLCRKFNCVLRNTARQLFRAGQSVVITGCGIYDGTFTVTDDRIAPFVFTSATAEADSTYTIPQIPAGLACIDGATAGDLYAGVAPIKSAILVVSVEVFQSVTAPGNQIMSDQFQPSPFILGRSLSNRIIGLLGPFLEVETMCL